MIRHLHRAVLMSRIIRPHEIIDVSGTQPQCNNRAELGAPCIVRLRDEVLHNDNDYETYNGANFVIHVPLPAPADHDEDVFSSMAMQPMLHPPQAAVVDMPDAAQQDDVVEDPPTEVELPDHPDDEPPDHSPDDEGQSTFLFQLDYDPHHVRLPDHGIERAIRQALNWRRNDLRSWHPLHHIPEDLASTSTAGIIVHQQGDIPTGSTHQLVLVDVIFFSNDPVAETEVDRTVRLLPQYLTKRALFTSLGLQPFCDELQDYQCVLWHNAQGIQVDNFVIKTVHGDYIRIWIPPLTKSCQIPTRFVAKCLEQGHARHQLRNIYMEHMEDAPGSIDPRRIPSVDPHMRRTDDTSLLQHQRLTVRPRTTLQLQTLIPETTMMISCDRVLFLRQQCMTLPQSQVFTRHSVVKWHDSTLAAFETVPEWTMEYPTALHFFTDGTSSRINGCWQGASAIVLIVSTTEGDRFGGFRCYSDDETMTAPRAELSAMLGAVAWACELLQGFDTSPPVSFNYDSLLAGNCANGLWTLHCHPDISGPLRAMVHWMLQCYGPIFSWAHVRAHEGHAWNEAADAVAWACQFGWIPRQPLRALLDILTFDRTDFKTVEWLWFIEASLQHCPEVPRLHGRSLRVNLAAPFQKLPDDSIHSLMRATDQPAISTMPCRLTLRCVTANVLTLYGMKRNDTETTYGSCISARQEALLQLCHAQQMHLVGIQETRSRLAGYASCEHYHILAAPSTSRGVGGVQLWVAKVWASTPQPVHISADDLKIVHSSSQRLVVRLRHHDLKFLILAGHAPNNAEPQALRDWWNGCTTACPTTLRTWPMIALLDANARIGSVASNSVGSFQQQTENAAGEAFHHWLADEDLVVPQTFEQTHTGPGHTWTHASGATARLDYVAISRCITDQCAVRTQIADIDLSISKQDHNAVQLEVDIEFSAPLQRAQSDIPHLPWNFDWDTDVHTHAAYLQNFVQCHHRQERPRLRPHRAHMTDSTWQLVLAKKYHWRRQRELRRTLKTGQLRAVFSAWARRVPSHDCAPWLRVTHQALALHEHRHALLSKETANALLNDDRCYYERLAIQAGEAADEGLHSFWKQVKAVLPRQQQKRRSSLKCIGPDSAELAQHYCSLEAGEAIDYPTLLHECFRRQREQIFEAPLSAELTSFPTRLELERLCRKAKNGKAPGIDGLRAESLKLSMQDTSDMMHKLFFKIWATGAEPLQYKGGLVWSIAKRPGACTVDGLRGIALLETVGKVFHALLRQRLMSWTLPFKLETQFGGYSGQQIAFPSLLLRSFLEHVERHRLSSAVIFVDIRSAFHCMLRELVFGTRQDFPDVLAQLLAQEGFDVETLRTSMSSEAAHFQDTASPIVARVASDAHQSTWFVSPGTSHSQCYVTHRGSRPGSPVADIAYNILMTAILRKVEAKLEAHPGVHEACAHLGLRTPIITWVDDVAVPVVSLRADTLLDTVTSLLQDILDIFSGFGLRLNLTKGKTEIILQHRGPGAPALRRSICFEEYAQIPVSNLGKTEFIRVVSTYKHLGSHIVTSMSIAHDVTCRMAKASNSFRQLSRPIFLNRKINITTRLRLLEALVIPMITFGCGHWPLLPHRVYVRLNHLILKWQRSIINDGFWLDNTTVDWRLQAKWKLVPLTVRLRKHRLLFALQLAKHAPALVWDVVTAEDSLTRTGTWIYALRQALDWYRDFATRFDTNTVPDSPLTAEQISLWLVSGGMATSARVNDAVKRFVMQEHTMDMVLTEHQHLSDTMEQSAVDFSRPPDSPSQQPLPFGCNQCHRRFATPQGLNTHGWVMHKHISLERRYIHTTTCLSCNRCFWTVQRLQQHLRHSRRHADGEACSYYDSFADSSFDPL